MTAHPLLPERLSAGSLQPPSTVERRLLAVRRYKAGAPLTAEEQRLALEQLCHELRTTYRRGWWEQDRALEPLPVVLQQLQSAGWRTPELHAAVGFLRATGVQL